MSFSYGHAADKQEMISLLRSAVERGVTFFDTAEVYRPFTNEELLGKVLSPFSEQEVIATKFGFKLDPNGRPKWAGLDSRPEHIRQVAEASHKRLKVDAIDLFYQHRVDPDENIGAVAIELTSNDLFNIDSATSKISEQGIWYNGPGLSFEKFVKRAKDYGYDGIELDNKRPQGNPMDIPPKRRDEMRNILANAAIEIPAVACNNDFSSPIPEHCECQLVMVKETTRMARDLGAKIVRLFPAWTGISLHEKVGSYDLVRSDYYSFQRQYPYSTMLDRWNFVKECLKESAGFG